MWWKAIRNNFICNYKIFNLGAFSFVFLSIFYIFKTSKRKSHLFIFFSFFFIKVIKFSSINKLVKFIYAFKLKPSYLSCIKNIFIFQFIRKHFYKKHIFSYTCNNKRIVPYFYNIIPSNRLPF